MDRIPHASILDGGSLFTTSLTRALLAFLLRADGTTASSEAYRVFWACFVPASFADSIRNKCDALAAKLVVDNVARACITQLLVVFSVHGLKGMEYSFAKQLSAAAPGPQALSAATRSNVPTYSEYCTAVRLFLASGLNTKAYAAKAVETYGFPLSADIGKMDVKGATAILDKVRASTCCVLPPFLCCCKRSVLAFALPRSNTGTLAAAPFALTSRRRDSPS